MVFYIVLILCLAGIDQCIKYWIRANLTSNSYIEVIPNFIHLTYQGNKGISFSFLSNLPEALRVPLLTGIPLIIVVCWLLYVYKRWIHFSHIEKWGFALILAGAIGNLWDRIFRQQVTDYMCFHFYETGFFVNNFADDLISIGFVLIVIRAFFAGKQRKR